MTLTAKWLPVNMYFTVDNDLEVYHNGTLLIPVYTPACAFNSWQAVKYYHADLKTGDVVAVKGIDLGVVAGFIGEIRLNNITLPTQANSLWRQSEVEQTEWNTKNFIMNETWGSVTNKTYASWDNQLIGAPDDFYATWVWSENNVYGDNEQNVNFFRYVIGGYPVVTFDSNGGNAIAAVTVPAGTSFTSNEVNMPVPTKAGCNFTNWLIENTTIPFVASTIIDNSIKVIAQYTL